MQKEGKYPLHTNILVPPQSTLKKRTKGEKRANTNAHFEQFTHPPIKIGFRKDI